MDSTKEHALLVGKDIIVEETFNSPVLVGSLATVLSIFSGEEILSSKHVNTLVGMNVLLKRLGKGGKARLEHRQFIVPVANMDKNVINNCNANVIKLGGAIVKVKPHKEEFAPVDLLRVSPYDFLCRAVCRLYILKNIDLKYNRYKRHKRMQENNRLIQIISNSPSKFSIAPERCLSTVNDTENRLNIIAFINNLTSALSKAIHRNHRVCTTIILDKINSLESAGVFNTKKSKQDLAVLKAIYLDLRKRGFIYDVRS